jgi:hypothetical protein
MELTILAVLSCLAAGPGSGWLDAYDPIWERPPVEWNTGIPLANGHIGALVWGDGAPLKLTLDAYDAWETREKPLNGLTYAKLREMVRDGRKEEAEKCMQTEAIYGKEPYPTRLPLPRLEISGIEGLDAEHFSGRLSLSRAEAEVKGGNARARIVVPGEGGRQGRVRSLVGLRARDADALGLSRGGDGSRGGRRFSAAAHAFGLFVCGCVETPGSR